MKKILISAFGVLAASSVFAAGSAVCAAPTTAGDGVAITSTFNNTGGGTAFVVNSFTPKCSAKVHLAFEQNATAAAVASGSSAGSKLFTGSTNGGSVAPTGTCATTGCIAGDATGATAATLAGST
jgi:hypothetical protein